VPGEIVLYRVLGARDDYLSSRPKDAGDYELTFQDTPSDGDTTRIVIGGRPNEYIRFWQQSWAWIVASLKHVGEWRDAENPTKARDEICDRLATEIDLPESLREECGLWVTVSVSRPCSVSVEGEGRYFWARSTEIQTLSEMFVTDVANHVDLVMAVIEAELGIALPVPVVATDRPMVFADERAPFSVPTFKAFPATISVGQLWESLDIETVNERVRSLLDTLPDNVRTIMSRAYRWLVMSEGDNDELRSFLFAFLGIEALASSLRNDVLPTAISRLQAELEDELPINDLIWPQPAGIDERPDRSALFQFAVLATALSPATAASDVDTFKQLQKDRHRLAHPKDHALDSFPFSEGQHLLRRYITLVANHTW
jgi:hypothetical protein